MNPAKHPPNMTFNPSPLQASFPMSVTLNQNTGRLQSASDAEHNSSGEGLLFQWTNLWRRYETCAGKARADSRERPPTISDTFAIRNNTRRQENRNLTAAGEYRAEQSDTTVAADATGGYEPHWMTAGNRPAQFWKRGGSTERDTVPEFLATAIALREPAHRTAGGTPAASTNYPNQAGPPQPYTDSQEPTPEKRVVTSALRNAPARRQTIRRCSGKLQLSARGRSVEAHLILSFPVCVLTGPLSRGIENCQFKSGRDMISGAEQCGRKQPDCLGGERFFL